MGTTSAAKVVTVTNSGTTAVTGTGVSFAGTNAADFAETTTCGSSLAGGSSCTFSVTFKPTALGTRTASLGIADSDPTSPQLVALTGTGTSPAAQLAPTSVAFGLQTINTTSTSHTVTLSNTGNVAMSITTIAFTGTNAADFARTTTCGTTLNAGASCNIGVTFRPRALELARRTCPSPTMHLKSAHDSSTGTGSAAHSNPTTLTYASQTVGTTSAAKVVTLTNSGTTALTAVAISLTGTNAADYARTTTCGTSLAAGGNCTISVTFTPTARGTRTATLTVTDSDPSSPQQVTITGTGK